MSSLFHNIFYEPVLNVLGVLILYLPGQSFGAAIIILTILINFLLLPLTHRMKKSQQKITDIQPHLDRIKREFKDNKEIQAKKTLELYREHGINPFSGFLLLLIQIPLFIALFRVLQASSESFRADLYPFLPDIPTFNPIFLGVLNLAKPNIVLAVIAGITQFIQGSLLLPPTPKGAAAKEQNKNDFQQIMQKQMRFVMPLFVVLLGIRFPAALALYWTTLSVFGIVHESIVRRRAKGALRSNGGDHQQPKH